MSLKGCSKWLCDLYLCNAFILQLVKDWMLFAIVGVVVSVDVIILLVGTAVPQSRLTATLTTDVEHPSTVNVRMNYEDENIHNYVLIEILPCL